MAKRWGKRGSSDRFPLVLSNHCGWWLQSWNQKPFAFWKESYDKPRQCAENQRQYSAIKVHTVKAMIFPSGNVQLWELDRKEGKAPKNWCLQTMVLESPLNGKEIKSVNLKGNQPWILTGRADAEVEALVFWSSDMKSWLTGKVPDAGKTVGRRRRGHQRIRWLDSIANAMDMNLGKLWEMVRKREVWHAAVHGVTKSDTIGQLNNNVQ